MTADGPERLDPPSDDVALALGSLLERLKAGRKPSRRELAARFGPRTDEVAEGLEAMAFVLSAALDLAYTPTREAPSPEGRSDGGSRGESRD